MKAIKLKPSKTLLSAAVLSGLAVLIYSFGIEPYWIETTYHTVPARIGRNLKIAHLSDLHTKGVGRIENKVFEILAAEKPDLIVITGDTYDSPETSKKFAEVLSRLKAPLGVYDVKGNWENWTPIKNERETYESAGIRLLVNQTEEAAPGVWVTGFDDPWTGHPHPDARFNAIPRGDYKIALFHSPMGFESLAGSVDLALAGHTHGGQVAFPLIGPLWLPKGCGPYLKGWFEKDGSKMYVSRGVGTSMIPVRLLSRPEVAIITLVPSAH